MLGSGLAELFPSARAAAAPSPSIIRRPLVEPAVYDLAIPSSREHTSCISFCVFMNFPVTLATESDQVALGIRALIAPELPVMNFDCGKRAAGLAAPAVALSTS